MNYVFSIRPVALLVSALAAGVSLGSPAETMVVEETVANIEAVMNVYATPTDGSYQSFLQSPRSYGVTLRANF